MNIVIPDHTPVSWNRIATMHYRTYIKLRNEVALLMAEALGQDLSVCQGPVRVTVDAYNPRPLDVDNVAVKLYVDALRGRWVLRDDDPSHVTSLTVHSYAGRARVVIRLEECYGGCNDDDANGDANSERHAHRGL